MILTRDLHHFYHIKSILYQNNAWSAQSSPVKTELSYPLSVYEMDKIDAADLC